VALKRSLLFRGIVPAVDFRADPLYVLTVLTLMVVAAEWLARRGPFRHVGAALLVILLTAIVANLGIIPAGSTADAPVSAYDAIFTYVAPIALFWLLLPVSLREVFKAGLPLISLFFLGALGTCAGVYVGITLVNGREAFGPLQQGVAGMFTGTYIGGSVNFNALALHYDVMRDGMVYGGSIVVDNIMTTVWMIATIAAPRLLLPLWKRRGALATTRATTGPILELPEETETIDPRTLALVLFLGGAALWLSLQLASASAAVGFAIPSILIITALALVLAQVPAVSRLAGVRVLGMYSVYVFLAVVGAFCDLRALAEIGSLGVTLLIFVVVIVFVHGFVMFGGAWLFKLDLESAAVASQANIGGGTSALVLAKSLGREDLVLPAILIGSLGNAVGTFLGFLVAGMV
jgi:uncharacterized membrane protein